MNEKLVLQYPEKFVKTIKDNFPNNRKMNLFVDRNDYFLGGYLNDLLENQDNNLSKKEEQIVESLYDWWILIVEEQMDGQNLISSSFSRDREYYDEESDLWINDSLGG